MNRRIAPNLLNTLADPAEYTLRLFYRGHESAAKSDPAPDFTKAHGPVQFSDDYRCTFWLDEHDYVAQAAEQAIVKSAADTTATDAKNAYDAAKAKADADKLAADNAAPDAPNKAALQQTATESAAEAEKKRLEMEQANKDAKAADPAEIQKAKDAEATKDAKDTADTCSTSVNDKAEAEKAKQSTQSNQAAIDAKKLAIAAKDKEYTDKDAAAKAAKESAWTLKSTRIKLEEEAAALKAQADQMRLELTALEEKQKALELAQSTAETVAEVSAEAAAKATARWVNEPAPLAKDTEIVKKDIGKKYRVLATDNHAATDTQFNNAPKNSKPDWYADPAFKWMKDVRPAVPLEAVIEKIADGKKIAIAADEVKVVWKIIDPAEELGKVDLGPGGASKSVRPKQWLTRFFGPNHFQNPDPANAENVNDNCPIQFGGLRTDGGGTPATSVLMKAPFTASAPAALDAAPGTDSATGAVSAVIPATDTNNDQIARSPVYFYPMPIGGDNFRFRLSLLDKDNKPVKFRDHEGKLVDFLETGPFTVWRRVVICVMVTFDAVDQSGINWEEVRQAYRPAFTEIVGPIMTKTFDEAGWKTVCKNYFLAAGFSADEVNSTGTFAGKTPFNYYNKYLIPSFNTLLPIVHPDLNTNDPTAAATYTQRSTTAGPPYDIDENGDRTAAGNIKIDTRWTHTAGLAKAFLDAAYKEFGQPNPRADVPQAKECFGLNVFFAKRPMEWSTVLGQYMIDREFQFVHVGDVTCTFAHELGHAVFMYHSYTSFRRGPAPANVYYTYVSEDKYQVSEHDQDDAIVCTMAYDNDYYLVDAKTVRPNGVRWHFCSVCLLKLRFWDLKKLQANAQVMKWIHEGLFRSNANSVKIADAKYVPYSPGTAEVAKAGEIVIRALAPAEATMTNSGRTFAKDITLYQPAAWSHNRTDLCSWGVEPPASAYYDRQLKLKGRNVDSPAPPPVDARVDTITYALTPPPVLLEPPAAENTAAPAVTQNITVKTT